MYSLHYLVAHCQLSPEARQLAVELAQALPQVLTVDGTSPVNDLPLDPGKPSPLAHHVAARHSRRLSYRELRQAGVAESAIKALARNAGRPIVAQSLQLAHLPVTLAVYYRFQGKAKPGQYWLMPLNGDGNRNG